VPLAWPPRSPDLTPLGFFLLGLWEGPRPSDQKQLSSAVESPHKEHCGYGNRQHASNHLNQVNIIWIYFVPPGVLPFKID
jgi:hypothetical protein